MAETNDRYGLQVFPRADPEILPEARESQKGRDGSEPVRNPENAPSQDEDDRRSPAQRPADPLVVQLLDSLLAVEWAGTDFNEDADEIDCCPNCGGVTTLGHFTYCELRDSLDAALGVKSPRLERVDG